jgi:SAM-dependent methyltransferase
MRTVGLDINAHFIAAAKAKDPNGEYHIGDMKCFRLRRRFDFVICLGTTFSYALTNQVVTETLANFRAHLKPSGVVVIDVLNAIAFTGTRPFKTRTEHRFYQNDFNATATIRHKLNLQAQTMTGAGFVED